MDKTVRAEGPSPLRVIPGGHAGPRSSRCRLPMYPDVRGGPQGYVEAPAAEFSGAEFLWAWQYDADNPAVYLPARWCGRSSGPPPGPGAAVVLEDNRLWCARQAPPHPVRARLLLPARDLGGMAALARRYWPAQGEKG